MTVGDGSFGLQSDVWPGAAKVIEEAGELLQVFGKLIMNSGDPNHWSGVDLNAKLIEEIADLEAALDFFMEHNMMNTEIWAIATRGVEKRAMFNHWREEGRKS